MSTTRSGLVCVTVMAASIVLMPGAAHASVRHFANCTAMHTVYKGGVSRKGAVDHRSNGGHAKYRPYVSTPLYNANRSMDRDHDGIACEK